MIIYNQIMDIQEQQNHILQYYQQPGQSNNQKMMEQIPQMQSQPSTPMKDVKQFLWGYQIHRDQKLGKGNFGKVFLATKSNAKPYQDEMVAVKIFPTPKANTYDHLSMKRQIDILKTKNTPHIIKFLFQASFNGEQYIFMELAKGDLRTCIEKCLIPEEQAIQILRQIVLGLCELHDLGIIHRDLKPDNVFLVKDKKIQNNVIAKIGDFNLSRRQAEYTQKTAGVGTPLYMAPQLYKKVTKEGKSKYSYKCDIWSLGVIAYELVCQKTPWSNYSNVQQLIRCVEQTVKKGIQFPLNIPISDEYKDFVRGCLQYEENDRFDWVKISNHPIMRDQEPFEFEIIKPIITILRWSVQESNINLYKFFQDLPRRLNQQNVSNIFKALNHEITQDDMQLLIYFFFHGQDIEISNSDLVQFFKDNSFLIQENMQMSQDAKKIRNLDSVSKIYKNIKDLSKPFQQIKFFHQWISNNPKMNYLVFEAMMNSLSSKATKKHLEKFYKYFNSDNLMQINTETFIEQFCKFFQIVYYRDKKTEKQINKMKLKKYQENKEMMETEMKE